MDIWRAAAPILPATALITALLASSCGEETDAFALARSDTPRDEAPLVATSELGPLVEGNTAFALDLYSWLGSKEGNLFFSPYSISVALAMTYAGARAETAAEMAATLHFGLAEAELHPAFNRLDLELAQRSEVEAEDEEGDAFELTIANSIWAERTYEFLDEFLETLALNYGAGARLVDFIGDPEGARGAINDWVSEQTNDRIPELIPSGLINPLTRLVLTNAIYFKASWLEPFDATLTEAGDFHLLSGSTVSVPMMRSSRPRALPYAEAAGVQAVELPYVGDEVAMLILLPAEGSFSDFEAEMDAVRLNQIVASLALAEVSVILPKFEFSSDVPLKQTLTELGMPAAFEPGEADLSGMDGSRDLFIQDVLHKAFVSVDEKGTEAAAATAVIVGVTAAPEEPKVFDANRPFIFLIRDRVTGAVLFVGRVQDPGA